MTTCKFKVAFAGPAIALSSPASTFYGSRTQLKSPCLSAVRRQSRTRILALGAAPTPPPKEPEEGSEKTDADATADAAADATAGDTPPEEVTADDILNSPSFLKKKLEIVQKELIEAKAALEDDSEAVKEEKSRYVRLAADFENYRRRSMEDLRKQDSKSTAKVCKEILQVLDNFERATSNVEAQNDREKSIISSYEAINRQLLDALVRLKVEPIEAVGQVFDPEFHEAIQRMESTEHKEDLVCAQFQRGYKIGDTLIRAAVVGVSSGPGPADGEDSNGENGGNGQAIDVNASAEAGAAELESEESAASTEGK